MKKIAINGFGRIGRATLKIALSKKNIQVVSINDLADPENLVYLLKHDSVYQNSIIKTAKAGKDHLMINGKKIAFSRIAEPQKLPWKKMKIDTVLECTGVFTREKEARKHLRAGAKRVLISAPSKDGKVATVVKSVNHKSVEPSEIMANASCTTNCVAPVMAVLQGNFGMEKALLNTIHAVTASQRTVDLPYAKDYRRGRSALNNMIPTSTGAAKATILTMPELQDKFDGLAVRVPLVCGSLADLTVLLSKDTTSEKINRAFTQAAKSPLYKGVLATTDEPLVSGDIIGRSESAIVDLAMTRVVGGNLAKIIAWYDNEWGYANRLVEMVNLV